MQRNIFAGSEFLLYNIDNEPVAYSRNCALKINQSLTDVTTKDSQSWTELMVGIKDWGIEFEGLMSSNSGFTQNYFINKYKNNEPFFIRFGVIQENYTYAYYGEVAIASIDLTAQMDEVSTYSGSLKGIGKLLPIDEGTPEQNGYLKTETDPVFRGSPAFNITDIDKEKWNEANNKVVKEIQFITTGNTTTLKIKFNDGNIYSAPFLNNGTGSVDLSGYYTKNQSDELIAVAQVAADNANTLLYNIANDSKLTPNEKINVLKEWLIIQDEKPKLVQQAVIFGVQTLDYDVSYVDLELYVEPLLYSMNTTDDIAGYDFRNTFRAYYDEKIKLLKAIAEASKFYTDAEIEAITIGNRNYHLKGDKTVLVSQTSNQTLQSGNYPVNSEMALSFYARSIDGANRLFLQFDDSDEKEFNVSNDWIRYTCILHTTDLPILYARLGEGISMMNVSVKKGFPYKFPSKFGSQAPISGIEMKNIMVVKGNKWTDFVPAPEDFYDLINKAKTDATLASKSYSDAQDSLNKTLGEAYADGLITELEQVTIDLAESNLATAKQYADVQALNAKVLANAYADGKITDIENQIIDASEDNIIASKAYTDAQRSLSEITLKAYTDGVIDSTEAALIQNANNNLATAKQYADAQDLYTKTLSDAYADQKISTEEQARINAVQASLDAAKAYTEAQRVLSETITKAYADGVVSDEEARAIADAQAKLNLAKAYADQKNLDLKNELVDYVDQSIIDKANEIIADTTDLINVANTATLQAAETDAENKANAAKAAAIVSANTYAAAQRVLAETTSAAYADGVVTTEEQARITQAANNLQAAKDDSTVKANAAAAYGIAATNLHNALVGNLRSLAYEDVVEVSKLGSTIVTGGFIKTSLLDANYIKSDIITSTYINSLSISASTISATTGTIGGWGIDSTSLKSGTLTSNFLQINSGSDPYIFMKNADQVTGTTDYSQITPKSAFFSSKGVSTPTSYNNVSAVGAFKLNDHTSDSVTHTAMYLKAPSNGLSLFSEGSALMEGGNLTLNFDSIFVNGLQGATGGVMVIDYGVGGYYGMYVKNGIVVKIGILNKTLYPPV
jgi:Uncharacterized protein conserved in bacteria